VPGSVSGPGPLVQAAQLRDGTAWRIRVCGPGEGRRRDGSRRVAVIVERGDPDRLAPLLMAAYELTEREKDVTRLVLHGETTSSIAARLFVSPQTVQQHLKSIFDKTGVRSRRELVSKRTGIARRRLRLLTDR